MYEPGSGAAGPVGAQPRAQMNYVLGHAEDELRRLAEQSRFFDELTAQVFNCAGIGRGMHVLDAGCGVGDVSFLAARLVGSTGVVVGVDKSAAAVSAARRRAVAAGLRNVTFIEGDINDLSPGQPFDAAVGRLVLMYQTDPAATLRRAAEHVRAGGLLVFQEMDMSGAKSLPELPLFAETVRRLTEAFRRSGAETQMGLKLRPTFEAAGLRDPQSLMCARVEGGPHSFAYELLARTTHSVLPVLEKFGVAGAAEVQTETLAARLRAEALAGGGVLVVPPLVGTWARRPKV